MPKSYESIVAVLESLERNKLTIEFAKCNFKYKCGRIGHRRSNCRGGNNFNNNYNGNGNLDLTITNLNQSTLELLITWLTTYLLSSRGPIINSIGNNRGQSSSTTKQGTMRHLNNNQIITAEMQSTVIVWKNQILK